MGAEIERTMGRERDPEDKKIMGDDKDTKVWPRGEEKKSIKAKERAEKEAAAKREASGKKGGKGGEGKSGGEGEGSDEEGGGSKRPRDGDDAKGGAGDGGHKKAKVGGPGAGHSGGGGGGGKTGGGGGNKWGPPKKGGSFQHKFLEGTFCLCCRQEGHTMAQCRKNPNKEGGNRDARKSKLTCFNCGKSPLPPPRTGACAHAS